MKHSSYFGGAVQSLGFANDAGEATVGVMEPGEYTFTTGKPERMQIVSGALDYRVPGSEWASAKAGEQFSVPGALQKLEFRAHGQVAYICWFG